MPMTEPALTPQRFARLTEGAAAVAGQADLAALLRTTVDTAVELTSARYGALGVIGEHGTLIEFIHAGMDPEIVERIGPPPRGRGVLGTIIRMGKTIRIDRIQDHPDYLGFPQHHPPMTSFLGVPIAVGDRVYGNLYLADKAEGFTAEDEALTEALAVVAGSAISTARLQRRLRRVAVIEDRERIARDLHDAIIQELFAVGLALQALSQKVNDPDTRSGIGGAVDRLDECITSLRKFIFDLRPPAWATRNLQAELSDLVGQLAAPYRALVEVSVEGSVRGLSSQVIDDTLQIVREAVSNALRHSGSDRVEVSVERDTEHLIISVRDHGRGFDPAQVRRGMGLDNLSARAAAAQGGATIDSRPGEGTTIRVTVPC